MKWDKWRNFILTTVNTMHLWYTFSLKLLFPNCVHINMHYLVIKVSETETIWTLEIRNHICLLKTLRVIMYKILFRFCLFVFFFCLLGPHPWYMEVLRLGIKSEPQLSAYTTATATQDPSCIWDLCRSSRQCQILHPLGEARDWTHILMDPSQDC